MEASPSFFGVLAFLKVATVTGILIKYM